MTYANTAAIMITLYCRAKFDGDDSMGSTVANGSVIDAFDHTGHGSHKYIDAERYTADLEMNPRSGVYGYWGMADKSILLLTCGGKLAYVDAPDATAQWPTI